jgi:anti-sigma regulatory factor (Ser/Thr protein kinase)
MGGVVSLGRVPVMVAQVAGARVHEHDHVVGFYDGSDDLVGAVAAFIADGLHDEGAAIVVATAEHRAALERTLREVGIATPALTRAGRYRTFDAAEMLAAFMHDGRPEPPGAFRATIGPIVDDAARGGVPVRIFGEMVALLWDAGNVGAAIDLESLWNDLAAQHPFTLYCAYPTAILQTDDNLEATKQVCDQHSSVMSLSADLNGYSTFAAGDEVDSFDRWFMPTRTAVRTVRTFVADVLRSWEADDVADSAQIIASELATNAVVHARSPFRLSIARRPDAIEIAVRDASTAPAELRPIDAGRVGGRGLVLIAELSKSWGTHDETDGKTVWAELGAT